MMSDCMCGHLVCTFPDCDSGEPAHPVFDKSQPANPIFDGPRVHWIAFIDSPRHLGSTACGAAVERGMYRNEWSTADGGRIEAVQLVTEMNLVTCKACRKLLD